MTRCGFGRWACGDCNSGRMLYDTVYPCAQELGYDTTAMVLAKRTEELLLNCDNDVETAWLDVLEVTDLD